MPIRFQCSSTFWASPGIADFWNKKNFCGKNCPRSTLSTDLQAFQNLLCAARQMYAVTINTLHISWALMRSRRRLRFCQSTTGYSVHGTLRNRSYELKGLFAETSCLFSTSSSTSLRVLLIQTFPGLCERRDGPGSDAGRCAGRVPEPFSVWQLHRSPTLLNPCADILAGGYLCQTPDGPTSRLHTSTTARNPPTHAEADGGAAHHANDGRLVRLMLAR